MRTTLRIDDDLMSDLKRTAEREKTSLSQCVNSVIRQGLQASRHRQRNKRRYRQKTYDMGAPLVDITKALALAAELEDQEIIRGMAVRR